MKQYKKVVSTILMLAILSTMLTVLPATAEEVNLFPDGKNFSSDYGWNRFLAKTFAEGDTLPYEGYDGKYITIGSNTAIPRNITNLEWGKTYTLGGWFRDNAATPDGCTIECDIYRSDNTSSYYTRSFQTFAGSNGWTYGEKNITIPAKPADAGEDVTAYVTLIFRDYDTGADSYADMFFTPYVQEEFWNHTATTDFAEGETLPYEGFTGKYVRATAALYKGMQPSHPLEWGETYILSGWARSNDATGTGGCPLTLYVYSSETGQLSKTYPGFATNGGWTYNEREITIPAKPETNAETAYPYIGIQVRATEYTKDFADLSLKKKSNTKTQAVYYLNDGTGKNIQNNINKKYVKSVSLRPVASTVDTNVKVVSNTGYFKGWDVNGTTYTSEEGAKLSITGTGAVVLSAQYYETPDNNVVSSAQAQKATLSDGKNVIRFLALVDSSYASYEKAGFVVTTLAQNPTVEAGYKPYTFDSIFTKVKSGEDVLDIENDTLLSKFTKGASMTPTGILYANLVIEEGKEAVTYYATPYVEKADGTRVYGQSKAISYTQLEELDVQ